ncbi:GDP-mannose 4,6-dehydratase [Aurantivibrio infirmus]
MKILLTGADGFVGEHVNKQIETETLSISGSPVDIRDSKLVDESINQIKPDAVIHLAAQSFVPRSFENPIETFDINFIGTFNLLNALKKIGFRGKFLHVGSGDIYGYVAENDLPVRESLVLKPRNPYAVSKVAAEALCYQWSQCEDFEIVIARSFNHIGPGQSEKFVISSFARQIVEISMGLREPKIFVGDIDVTRDFTDVRDIVRAYQLLLQKGLNGEAYNVCSGKEYQIRYLLEQLIRISGVKAEILTLESLMRPVEQKRAFGSAEKIFQDTGWSINYDIEQTLSDVLDDWRVRIL